MRLHDYYSSAVAVVKSDATVLEPTDALWVGGAGDVAVKMANGDAVVTLAAVPAGSLLKLKVTQVRAATTATNIVRLYY